LSYRRDAPWPAAQYGDARIAANEDLEKLL